MKNDSESIDFDKIRIKITRDLSTISGLRINYLYFYKGKRRIAEMYLVEFQPGRFETHAFINDRKYKGKGLGVFMYSRAIEWSTRNGNKKLYSALKSTQSQDAKKLWRSKRLRDKYQITGNKFRWTIQKHIKE